LKANRKDIRRRAAWTLVLALPPLIWVMFPADWLDRHVNVHNDLPLVVPLMLVWLTLLIAAFVGVPYKCWRLADEVFADPERRRFWRIAIILTNLVGCIVFLILVLIRRASPTGSQAL